jgi:hypothetical protein
MSTLFNEQELKSRLAEAVRQFWRTRASQAERQGIVTGVKDAGFRSAVTGGAQLNGFIELVRALLCHSGVPQTEVYCEKYVELPGWFRPEKKWDLLLVRDKQLLACIEFKSQVGSFGNNFNNRTEEALGNATDILAAYREGAFSPSQRPWLGFLMVLEDSPESTRPVKLKECHFKAFPEFKNSSYEARYNILLTKLLRERLYDGTCLLMTDRIRGQKGGYREPSEELAFVNFMRSLFARVIAS